MNREAWSELRGYPEWEMFSWNIDSLLMYQAAANHFAFVNLPASAAIFHVEHEAGSGWTPEGEATLFDRVERAGIPYLTGADASEIAWSMSRAADRGQKPRFNLDGWGLGEESLLETVPTHPGASPN